MKKSKKIISLILSFAMLLSITSGINFTTYASSSGSCGNNSTWSLDNNGILTISGTGEMYNYSTEQGAFLPGWYYSRSNIKEVLIENDITSIGQEAFIYCSNITRVTIPDSVTSIGDYAFENCSKLTSIIIPDSVTKIGYMAFYGCSSLKSIEILNDKCEIFNSQLTFPESAILYGYSGSSAEQYAKLYYFDFVLLGCKEHDYIKVPVLPTHYSMGYTIYICKSCDEVCYDDYVNALPHTYIEKQVIAPTCKSGGHTIYECTECGTTYISDFTEKLPNPTLYVYEEQLSTCAQNGYVVYFCEDCDDYYGMEILDLADHEFECDGVNGGLLDYTCDVCETKTTKTPNELIVLFEDSVINKKDDTSYLDVVDDGIINAKDYAMLLGLAK